MSTALYASHENLDKQGPFDYHDFPRLSVSGQIYAAFVGRFVGTEQRHGTCGSPTFLNKLPKLGPGLHHDGRGLYLQVKNGGRSWVFRYMRDRKPRYMGLGSYPDGLKLKARRKAEACRGLLQDGIDEIGAREEQDRQRVFWMQRRSRLNNARSST